MLLLAFTSADAWAGQVTVACASNFTFTLERLAQRFEQQSTHRVRIVTGSTGKLYSQIVRGAPYDIFLSADAATAERLQRENWIVDGKSRIYALGELVLIGPDDGSTDDDFVAQIKKAQGSRVAIANPKTAPYGRAAVETVDRLKGEMALELQFIYAENVAQTFSYVLTGNVNFAFVARAQTTTLARPGFKIWPISREFYSAIVQKDAFLVGARDNPAANAFYDYLHSVEAREIISAAGYLIP